MIRLLRVELTRFRSRRAIALLCLAAVVAAAVLVGMTAWETRPLSGSDRTDAAAQADLAAESPETRREVRACERRPSDYLGPQATAADCSEALVPGVESFYPRDVLDLGRAVDGRGTQLALIVVGLMVIAGGTFAGADWASRSLSHQLLFEPRRTRLWLAKAVAVTLGCALVTLVAVAGFWAALLLVADARGVAVPTGDVAAASWHTARSVALGAAAGLGAYAVTMVFRHTVVTLALLFVYAVAGDVLVNLLPVDGAARWAVGNNVGGWLERGYTYVDASIDCAPGERCSRLQEMTHLQAGSFLGVVLLVVLLVSVLWFRRRDV